MTGATAGRGDWLVVGIAGRPHGLDGSVHVNAARPGFLDAGMTVYVDGQPRRIVRRAGTDARPILRLDECASREAAEALRGCELVVRREAAPELGEDEWYAEDLVGCIVYDGDVTVGRVLRMLPLPSCEALEVQRGDGAEIVLVPLVKDAVRAVDVTARRIDIDLRFVEGR